MKAKQSADENDGWLVITAKEILATRDDAKATVVPDVMVTEEAVDVSSLPRWWL